MYSESQGKSARLDYITDSYHTLAKTGRDVVNSSNSLPPRGTRTHLVESARDCNTLDR